KVAGSARSESPPRGVMRGTAASSNALSSPPTWPSSRRTTTARSAHATPSSTWPRRSSRATAASSSDVCAPAHPAYDRAAPRCVGPCLDLVGAEQRFLGPQQELTNLVGESPEREHAPVRRPVRGVLSRQEFLHPRELVHGREQLRGPLVAEGPEELRHHVVGE